MSTEDRLVSHRDPDMFDLRFSLRDIYNKTLHHKLLVLVICILTLVFTTIYFVVWPPIYNAKATIMVERDTDEARDTFYVSWNVFRKEDARTEIELMTSGVVLKKVIEKENLSYDDVYHPPLSHLSYLWQKSAVGKWYRSIKKKIFPPEGEMPTDEEIEFGRTLHDMAAGISITPVAESYVGLLVVKGPSRRVAQLANTLLDVYLESRIQRHNTEAQKALDVLRDQTNQTKIVLQGIEKCRLEYVQEQGLFFDLNKETLEIAQLTETEASITGNRMKIAVLEATLCEVEKQLEKEPQTRITSTIYELNAVRENIKQKRLELQISLISIRNRYRADSPEVQEIERDIAGLDAMAANASERVAKATTEELNMVRQNLIAKRNGLRSELEGSHAGLAVLKESAKKLKTRLAKVPVMRDQLHNLDREAAIALQKYQELLLKQAQAEVSLSTSGLIMPSMRVVDYAVVPVKKSWPKAKLLFPAALLFGLFLGVCAAQLKSYIGGHINKETIKQGWGNVPLYGTVTSITGQQPFIVKKPKETESTEDSSKIK